MIKAASSRAILLIFSSFLPARAVGVVGYAAFLRAFVNDVAMTFVLGFHKRIIDIVQPIVCVYLATAPRQRQGKQGEEG